MTTCDRTALEHAICEFPLEDTSRLVYADWLEEHGGEADVARAEFIRVQIELAKGHPQGLKPSPPNLIGAEIRQFHKWGKRTAWGKQHAKLRARERSLFQNNAIGRFFPQEMGFSLTLTDSASDQGPVALLSRGFPSKVVFPSLASWERWGEAIVRAAPVTEINIAEFEPYQNGAGYAFFNLSRRRPSQDVPIRAEVPEVIFDLLTGHIEKGSLTRWKAYDNRDSALLAAARAFCDEARSRAKLPPVWSKP